MRTAGIVIMKLYTENKTTINKTTIKSACIGFASARLKNSGV